MKARLFFFTFLLFLFLFSACSKNNSENEVFGRVTEFGTEKPLEGAEVYILDCRISGSTTSCDTVRTLITDAAGTYSSGFPAASNGRTPKIGVALPGYFEHDTHFIRKHNDNEIDFVLDPFAWLSVRVVNEAPAGELDRIRLTFNPSGGGWKELTGSNVNELLFDIVMGNRPKTIQWKTYSLGEITSQMIDTVEVSAHDTLNYEIRY